MQANFVARLEAGEVAKSKNQMLMGEIGNSKSTVSDLKETIRNIFAKMVHALSGFEGSKNEVRNWQKLKCGFRLEAILEVRKKNANICEISKM